MQRSHAGADACTHLQLLLQEFQVEAIAPHLLPRIVLEEYQAWQQVRGNGFRLELLEVFIQACVARIWF